MKDFTEEYASPEKVKVAIIGSVGLPAKYGGWETLVHHLTLSLHEKVNFNVYCSSRKYNSKMTHFNGAKLTYINLDANGVQSIFYDFYSMLKSMRNADILLVLGVSGCAFLPLIKLFGKARIIVNIDGLEWKREKWGFVAKLFLRFSELIAVKFADIVIADNQAILNYITKTYKRNAVLIPYGGDHATNKSKITVSSDFSFISEQYAFKVCRIEPENNLDIILKAFESINSINLVIVGNWGNSEYGVSLKNNYQKFKHIYLLDPIYDVERLDYLRSRCSFYIHGHSAGGTNPSLVEAMSLGLSIFAYDCNFNRETTENSAIYFTDANDLVLKLKSVNKISLNILKEKMKSIATKRYTWKVVSMQYLSLFQSRK